MEEDRQILSCMLCTCRKEETLTTKGKMKPIRAWAIYHIPTNDFFLNQMESGIYARGIQLEKVAMFFRPEEYKVIQVEIRPVNNPPTKRK